MQVENITQSKYARNETLVACAFMLLNLEFQHLLREATLAARPRPHPSLSQIDRLFWLTYTSNNKLPAPNCGRAAGTRCFQKKNLCTSDPDSVWALNGGITSSLQ